MTTLELAAEYAREFHLGEWVAELDVPDDVGVETGRVQRLGSHVDLIATTPDQVRDYLVAVHPLGACQGA